MIRMIQSVPMDIELLPSYEGLPLPAYQTEGSAGFDLMAVNEEPIVIEPGKWVMVPTGLKFAVPQGCELQIRPRSGLAAKHGVTVLNTPGTIDSDYRGEVKVILINLSSDAFSVERGMRIAQAVLAPYYKAEISVAASLGETERGAGGFGHTGV